MRFQSGEGKTSECAGVVKGPAVTLACNECARESGVLLQYRVETGEYLKQFSRTLKKKKRKKIISFSNFIRGASE